MIMKEINFAVTSHSFNLIEAFKKECEEMGWEYNELFTIFKKGNFRHDSCLYFSNNFRAYEGKPAFSISYTDEKKLSLPIDWEKAIEFAKTNLEKIKNKSKRIVPLTNDYTAEIRDDGIVQVGCQEIPFNKVEELYEAIQFFKK